ncbi:MAG: 1-deoxy-D-xylulose-5-phosphate reductoisomerase [Chloroflexota bacterium]
MVIRVKNIAVLGATGSIGRQTLEVVRALPGRFRVVALAAGSNRELLSRQISEFAPEFYGCADGQSLPGVNARNLSLEEIAAHPGVDCVVVATAGSAGLRPVLAAARAGKQIALANKESLVMAGEIITGEVTRSGARILPVDSEHSAIWQCLRGERSPLAQLVLTASGGPFRDATAEELAGVTPEQALRHPSWSMGKKVTIDSATLMNKGLETIEAHWLFGVSYDRIRVLVHPQSIVHSMVEFADGAVKAQLSCPDMRLPIQHALTYPDRLENAAIPRLDWGKIDSLDFAEPDRERFPCLPLAMAAGEKGGTCPAVLCAADEVAVALFLKGRIGFTDIARLVAAVIEAHQVIAQPALEQILEADAWAREKALGLAGEKEI